MTSGFLLCFCIASVPSLFAHDSGEQDGCIKDAPKTKLNGILVLDPTLKREVSIVSPGGNFKIHFDTSAVSVNSVQKTDNNRNGIPDYVDSVSYYMDAAYDFEVRQLGYREPVRDNIDGKTYDIYLVQLGKSPGYTDSQGMDYGANGYYGVTMRDEIIPNSGCKKVTSTTFMLLDNDFSSLDTLPGSKRRTYADTGMVALKITCFHEFHHMIQCAYSSTESRLFFEMTSTWMEHAGFPDILNYALYVKRLFNNTQLYCLSCNDNDAGSYGYSIMMQFMSERYGRDVIRRMWEQIGRCDTTMMPMSALDVALRERNASLTEGWCEAMDWFYATGYRSDASPRFSNAAQLPLLSPDNIEADNQRFSEPSFSYIASVFPFQFKMIRCLLPRNSNSTNDTVDFVVTNNDIQAYNDGSFSLDYQLSIVHSPQNGYQRLGNLDYYYNIINPKSSLCDKTFINNGISLTTIDEPYPNPFLLNEHQELVIPVPAEIPADQKVDVYIFTTDGAGVYSSTQTIEIRQNAKTAVVKLSPELFHSGVYIFSVRWKDVQRLGKFAVKK